MRQGCINEIILRIALEHGITTSSICKIHKNVSWNGEHVIGLYTQMTAC
jgi:glutamine synthetase